MVGANFAPWQQNPNQNLYIWNNSEWLFVRPVDFNTPRSGGSLHQTPFPTTVFAHKALLSDVTYLSFLRRRRYYRTLPSCHFASKALISDVTYLWFLRRKRDYRTLPICHFYAESATIGRYLSVIFAPTVLLSDVTSLSFLRRRR